VEKGIRKITFAIMVRLLQSAFTPLEESVKLGIWLAASKNAETLSGKYLKRREDKVIARSSGDGDDQKRLWELCEKLTGARY
jgi:hypothetical protein